MLNVIGITLSFIGTLATLIGILASNPKDAGTWGSFLTAAKDNHAEKWLAIIGLVMLTVGYLIQLLVALSEI